MNRRFLKNKRLAGRSERSPAQHESWVASRENEEGPLTPTHPEDTPQTSVSEVPRPASCFEPALPGQWLEVRSSDSPRMGSEAGARPRLMPLGAQACSRLVGLHPQGRGHCRHFTLKGHPTDSRQREQKNAGAGQGRQEALEDQPMSLLCSQGLQKPNMWDPPHPHPTPTTSPNSLHTDWCPTTRL